MTRRQKTRPVKLGSRDWFAAVGRTSLTLGSPQFEAALVDLFGSLIDHSARWIIRFSDAAPPEVMHTDGVPEPILALYRSACATVDPFAAHWRLHREAGVRALSQFKDVAGIIDPEIYNATFKPAAKVSDELGMFLSTIGQSSIGLFLEREVGEFADDELKLAKAAFPILNGLQRAHIGRVFDRMRYTGTTAEADGLSERPTLVQDRHGVEIFATPSWRAAAAGAPDLHETLLDFRSDAPAALRDVVVTVERLDKYFPLAPGGRMLTLRRNAESPDERSAEAERTQLLGRLTPREQDVFNLILSGGSTSTISKILSLTKGTVKNYKLRIYKKADADSERALIQRYGVRELRRVVG